MAVCQDSPRNGHIGASVSLLLEPAGAATGWESWAELPAPWPDWHIGCLIVCPMLPPLSALSLLPGVPPPAPWPAPLLCCSLHGELHGHPHSPHTPLLHTPLLCCNQGTASNPYTHLSTLARMCRLTHTHKHTGNSPLWTHTYGCSCPYTCTIAPFYPCSMHTHTHTETRTLSSSLSVSGPRNSLHQPLSTHTAPALPAHPRDLQPSSPISLIPPAPFAFPDRRCTLQPSHPSSYTLSTHTHRTPSPNHTAPTPQAQTPSPGCHTHLPPTPTVSHPAHSLSPLRLPALSL